MLYHFEFRGQAGWEACGSGGGTGDDAVEMAVGDLQGLTFTELPPGEYRCIAATGQDARWIHFELGPDGALGPRTRFNLAG